MYIYIYIFKPKHDCINYNPMAIKNIIIVLILNDHGDHWSIAYYQP